MERPNILWICTDQQRFDTLGCYGNPLTHTPNLNYLARNGVLFQNAFSQSPVCTPSRGCFLTGRYPRTCRARQNGANIPESEIPVTKILSDNGYICGLSGKLHLSACDASICRGSERRTSDGYDVFHWSHDNNNVWFGNQYHLWLKEKQIKYITKRFKPSRFIQIGQKQENSQAAWCFEKAISFIKNNLKFDKPWLFSINPFHPHHPFNPPEKLLNQYLDNLDEIPLPNYVNGELKNKTEWQKIDFLGASGNREKFKYSRMREKDHRLVRAAYWAMCDLIDIQVGRIIDVLEDTNQIENTIIIFMSDHGEMLGDHGIYLKGPHFYDPAIHVPLIMFWKNKILPKKINSLVELIDIPQTILELMDIPSHPGMQGKSLWSLISGSEPHESHREDVYCEYYNAMPFHHDPTAQTTMVRTRKYKLTVDHTRSYGELYDLENDPNETYNKWNHSDYSEIKMEMLIRLCNRMAFTVDPLPLRIGEY